MFWTLCLTWPFYFIGGLYVVGPVLGWPLMMLALAALYFRDLLGKDFYPNPMPFSVLVWVFFMFIMLVVLWVGHVNNGFGVGATIKSSIGWAKGWALFFVFQIVGAVLQIRTEPLIRAQCVVGLITLLLIPLFVAASAAISARRCAIARASARPACSQSISMPRSRVLVTARPA